MPKSKGKNPRGRERNPSIYKIPGAIAVGAESEDELIPLPVVDVPRPKPPELSKQQQQRLLLLFQLDYYEAKHAQIFGCDQEDEEEDESTKHLSNLDLKKLIELKNLRYFQFKKSQLAGKERLGNVMKEKFDPNDETKSTP